MVLVTDYQIALIIITIIGFIVSTAFYVYFVYLPAARAEDQIDIIIGEGEDLITLVNQRVEDVQEETITTLTSVCESIKALICVYNHQNFTNPCGSHPPRCVLSLEAYPDYCQPFVPFTNTCTDCPVL